ncbi:MAG: hypothetical protein WB036_10595 [Pseudolabrys sp.]|uniref:hypothetical protein n=1 Tax=Bradyrhizobium sp. TaxID=376 RepID=UPI003C3B2FAA
MDDRDEPKLEQIEEWLLEMEQLGLMERVRDARGNVVTKVGSDGKPKVVWRRTAVMLPSTARH